MALIQVELSKIIIDEKRQDQIIVLKEKGGDRQFPIVIGFLEASSIKMKLSGIESPRPMTHDLLVSTIEELEATMSRLVIDKLVHNTFHAKLESATCAATSILTKTATLTGDTESSIRWKGRKTRPLF